MTEARRGLTLRELRSSLVGPFTLGVGPGEILAVSGASGSGKSLFLRMIADLDPSDGEVSLGEVPRISVPAPAWRAMIPYVAAESGWWARQVHEHFTAGQLDAAWAMADRLGVGATPFEGEVERLSTGERQRLALVRALILNSPALLLDEPTGPLDPTSTARVEAVLLERRAAGAVIVLATHDPAQALRLGARRMQMVDRRLVDEA